MQELSAELQVSQPISAYLHAMIRREIARGVWSLFWNGHHLGNLTGFPTASQKKNTLQLLQPVLVDIFVGTYRSGKPLWEIQMINSSQPGEVGEVPSHRIILGGFAQGAGCALRAALSFPDSALGGSVILSGFFGDPSVP